MANHDEFLREITLRICSSLEIRESMCNAFEYLREHFPIDMLTLFIIDERLGAVRRIAYAFDDTTVPPNEIIPLPEGMIAKIAARNFSEPFVVDAEDEIFRALAPLTKIEGNTDLIVPLRTKGEPLGGVGLRARGEVSYSDRQVRLLGSIAKPFAIALANALAHEEVLRYQSILLDDKRFLNRELYGGTADEIIGGNTGLSNVMEMVHQVASLNNTVLLLGETGTGKEMIANIIHYNSPRKNAPFVKINCAALTESLLESELFGHEKGAFTGADRKREGKFRQAEGGSIFLDEVSEMSPAMQVKLLRVLQERELTPVGSAEVIAVNVRVIAASNKRFEKRNGTKTLSRGSFLQTQCCNVECAPVEGQERRYSSSGSAFSGNIYCKK